MIVFIRYYELETIVTNFAMFSFPISNLIQIKKATSNKKAGEDLSVGTFMMFILANMSAFIYTEKGFSAPNIMNFIYSFTFRNCISVLYLES